MHLNIDPQSLCRISYELRTGQCHTVTFINDHTMQLHYNAHAESLAALTSSVMCWSCSVERKRCSYCMLFFLCVSQLVLLCNMGNCDWEVWTLFDRRGAAPQCRPSSTGCRPSKLHLPSIRPTSSHQASRTSLTPMASGVTEKSIQVIHIFFYMVWKKVGLLELLQSCLLKTTCDVNN